MERAADVVIVGAGIVGCTTAYYVARRGVRAVVVERAAVPSEQSRTLPCRRRKPCSKIRATSPTAPNIRTPGGRP